MPARSKPQTLARESTLLCLGDSLTFGHGAAAGASYPEVLAQLTGYATQNAGVNGDTAQGALARLPRLLRVNAPGLVLVSIGCNDFLMGLAPRETRTALMHIVQAAAASAQVVLIAQPQPETMTTNTSALTDHPVYAEVAAETGTPLFADGWSQLLSHAELRSDDIHANAAGYVMFAGRLAGWLRDKQFIA